MRVIVFAERKGEN